ncbi:uncharacterized protein LOC141901792 isoform X2 [Tubulanus polymorphus]|uniref:uncharacterized protein LOC141901792 isoform X2 n=1 Tax=Tubulanus polymorphus TaxID=672921 RepID=UPI003DA66E76
MAAVFLAFVLYTGYLVGDISTAEKLQQRCPTKCSCLGSMVDCSKKGLVTIPQDLPVWTEILELRSNSIKSISMDAFIGLSKLTRVDLSNNDLTQINSTVVESLPVLTEIKLAYNKLTKIPVFNQENNITHLTLHHNEIPDINIDGLESLSKLRNLDLNFNKIRTIKVGDFPAGTSLHHLFLNYNGITTLEPRSLDNLTSLEWLKLNRNKIVEIPKAIFSKLVNLKYLELNRNRIKVVEGLSFHGLEKLRVLKLRRNVITHMMDGSFWGLSNIQVLKLDHNNLTKISKGWLYGLSSLQQMSLAQNQIQQIEADGWEFCQLLWELDLNHNRLTGIGTGTFEKLRSLKFLHLSHNRISYIGDNAFRGLTLLEILEMSNNEISWTIEDMNGAFTGLSSLHKLSLENNRITSIAKRAFSGLKLMKILRLNNNAITTIQGNAFSELVSLQELYFNTTNLLCDCQLTWLPAWLEKSGFQTTVNAVCAHPIWLKGKNVLNVPLEDYKCEDFPKPVIITQPKSQIAIKTGNITLKCSVASSSNSPMQFQWKKNNLVVKDADVENYATTGDGRIMKFTTLLHLRAIRDADAGRYQCIVSNEFGKTYSKKAKIVVHVFPAFIKTPVDIIVQSSSTARLECAASGQPAPQIAWQKDGGDDFPAARERRMHVMPTDDVFFIVNVQPADAGVYSCTATNDAGTVIANATLRVLQTPSFVKRMNDQKSRVGETTVLECMASGSPKPKLSWLKDAKPLVMTPRHFFTAENQLLVIIQTQPTDGGRYTCEMSNQMGTESDSAMLTIVDEDDSPLPVGDGDGGSLTDQSTTIGIIVIAVVCCVVGTSLIWVIIIYKTRKKNEEYSSTPTDEITLPVDMPSASTSYQSNDKDGQISNGLPLSYSGQDLQTPDIESIYCKGHVAMQNYHSDEDTASRRPLVGFDNRASSISSTSPPPAYHCLSNSSDIYQRPPLMQTFQAYPPLDDSEESVPTSVSVIIHSSPSVSSRSQSPHSDQYHGSEQPLGGGHHSSLPRHTNTSQSIGDNDHHSSSPLSHHHSGSLPQLSFHHQQQQQQQQQHHRPCDSSSGDSGAVNALTDTNSNNIEPHLSASSTSPTERRTFDVLADVKTLPNRTVKV